MKCGCRVFEAVLKYYNFKLYIILFVDILLCVCVYIMSY